VDRFATDYNSICIRFNSKCWIKDLNLPLDSYNSTQYDADFHNGTTNVPLARSSQNFLMTLLAMHGGGTNQLHSYDQFCVNET
jgi:hypothetical protein